MMVNKSLKFLFVVLSFVLLSNTVLAQQTGDKTKRIFDCNQDKKEKTLLIKETDKNEYRVKRMEFWGNEFIRDKAFRVTMAFTEGDIFSKELLEKSIKNLNKSFKIYPISLKNVWIRLDKSNKDIDFVFCVKERK